MEFKITLDDSLCKRKVTSSGIEEGIMTVLFCRILRTPTEEIWPGVTQLSDYKATFPNWMTNNLESQMKNLNSYGLDLLQSMLTYDPVYRISARAALQHPYFNDLDKCKIPIA